MRHGRFCRQEQGRPQNYRCQSSLELHSYGAPFSRSPVIDPWARASDQRWNSEAGGSLPYFCEIGPAGFSAAFLSVARAPARIFTASLLSSLQSYSNIGPVVADKGIMADQGRVQVAGSFTVNLYSIVSADGRVKY